MANWRRWKTTAGNLQQELRSVDARIRLLRELRAKVLKVASIEQQLETSLEQDDSGDASKLKRSLLTQENELEFLHLQLRLNEWRPRLLELSHELRNEDLKSLHEKSTQLLSDFDKESAKIAAEFKDDLKDTDDLGPWLERQDDWEQRLERSFEILQLKLHRHWALEDGNEDDLREIEAELEELTKLQEWDEIDKHEVDVVPTIFAH